ncbi:MULTISPECIES: hypothetical protein [Ensifer]|uniref:Uncharacterized protein n=1 Tax=Ensifer adhaerens TaxID=106592 RepID=A0ABY8HAK7_ENSAD|nr:MULTISPECIES: hypothetical protein [Ensifer]MBD9544582.1 hypothetical protein [Ensifer sp. ENS04]SFF86940.1 hypothetical protein SAMN05216459_102183 [Ensifer sp. OV372]KDP75075.1 hypothetical protein FA04_02410 [Ensifer adhaerens]KQX32561.1 hypothetical protein ASD01_00980 [Ensifer sp. Root423]QHG69439.1 hypothetical protein DQW09_05905 [Ensifer adhaerens]
MPSLSFIQLNENWNADPNVPAVEVRAAGSLIQLCFRLALWGHPAREDEIGYLTFGGCQAWRLGATNDEGWFRGQCRYSRLAPKWGEFYELVGDDPLRDQVSSWRPAPMPETANRHFLFYLRDDTFECLARDWLFARGTPTTLIEDVMVTQD